MGGANDAALNIILGSKDETGPGIDGAEGKIGKLNKSVAGMHQAWTAFGASAAVATGFLSDASRASIDDAENVDHLRVAVENSGASWVSTQGAINARIADNEKLAFTHEQSRDSLAMLIAETGNLDEALKRQKIAMDFARGAHIDLETASKLLGKVTDQNVNVLGRYGIHVQKGADATVVMGEVQKRYGGQAESYGDSTKGSIDKIKNGFDEWKKSIGATMGPAQSVLALLPGLSAGFSVAGAASGFLTAEVTLLGDRSILATAKMGIVRVATLAWTAVQWLLNVALSANPIGLVVIGVAALIAGFILAYQHIKPFREAVDHAWAAIRDFATGIWSHVKPALDWLWSMLQGVAGLLASVVTGNVFGVASALHNLHIPGFAAGGYVPGRPGEPQIILAHGGELVLNQNQQSAISQPTDTSGIEHRLDQVVALLAGSGGTATGADAYINEGLQRANRARRRGMVGAFA